jgi:beta-glucanase (GH16 family)
MTKNYFTDKQVQEIAQNIDGYVLVEGSIFLSDVEFKNLINLAVESAIGEPLGTVSYSRNSKYVNYYGIHTLKDGNYSVYSVKELEN